MRRKFGRTCIILGTVLILSALFLMLYNNMESQKADTASADALSQLQQDNQDEEVKAGNALLQEEHASVFDELAREDYAQMKEVEIDGYAYIGYLAVPVLELELPVMSTWSYEQLKIAPCRQFGAVRSKDLVIAAHNFETHFGKLRQLQAGDLLTFTDMDQTAFLYSVEYVDILESTDVDKVEHSDFDLVLYTCTYGGERRVCVFCNLVEV